MAEYIKKEDAIAHPFANGHYDKKHANKDYILGHESYKEWIEDLPAADVVEVVRCRDCMYWYSNIKVCGRLPSRVYGVDRYECGFDVEDDFYCADGKRRQNKGDSDG